MNEKEKQINNILWLRVHPLGLGEDDYNNRAITLKELTKFLEKEYNGLKEYCKMSPKARRYGLWKNQGKLYRERIRILKELIKMKKEIKE